MSKKSLEIHPQIWLQMAQLRIEKCELKEAGAAFYLAFQKAKDLARKSTATPNQAKVLVKTQVEALEGLIRLACEGLDDASILKWEKELNRLLRPYRMYSCRVQYPPLIWCCQGHLAKYRGDFKLAQRCFRRHLGTVYLRSTQRSARSEELTGRAWLILAALFQERHQWKRSEWVMGQLLRQFEKLNFRGLNGALYLLKGNLAEKEKNWGVALQWFQKAHAQFLSEHNGYELLYVFHALARLERQQHHYSHAGWYLDLLDPFVASSDFGVLKLKLTAERIRLEGHSIDLLVDMCLGFIKTKEGVEVSLRKQYVLLHILESLSRAHARSGNARSRGLSKAEIVEFVWNENYSPELHDSKLYYNMNRLRKLIEPDVHRPQYLLNSKGGYRLAPELRIQYISDNLEPLMRRR